MYFAVCSITTPVMERGWLQNPFTTEKKHLTDADIIKIAKKSETFIIFESEQEAVIFADNYTQLMSTTSAANYVEYSPVLQVTLKDDTDSEQKTLLNHQVKTVKGDNIQCINNYFYKSGPYKKPHCEKVDLEEPLTLDHQPQSFCTIV